MVYPGTRRPGPEVGGAVKRAAGEGPDGGARAGPRAEVTIMGGGVGVYECTAADEVVDLLQGGQGVFGIALGRVWQEVEGTLAELPSERADDDEATAAAVAADELAKRRVRKTG